MSFFSDFNCFVIQTKFISKVNLTRNFIAIKTCKKRSIERLHLFLLHVCTWQLPDVVIARFQPGCLIFFHDVINYKWKSTAEVNRLLGITTEDILGSHFSLSVMRKYSLQATGYYHLQLSIDVYKFPHITTAPHNPYQNSPGHIKSNPKQ